MYSNRYEGKTQDVSQPLQLNHALARSGGGQLPGVAWVREATCLSKHGCLVCVELPAHAYYSISGVCRDLHRTFAIKDMGDAAKKKKQTFRTSNFCLMGILILLIDTLVDRQASGGPTDMPMNRLPGHWCFGRDTGVLPIYWLVS